MNSELNTDKKKVICDHVSKRLLETRQRYIQYAAELQFLQEGGNILDFKDWWEYSSNSSRYSLELDCIDAAVQQIQKPTSVVVIDVNENISQLFNWEEVSKELALTENTVFVSNVETPCLSTNIDTPSVSSCVTENTSVKLPRRRCAFINCDNVCDKFHTFPAIVVNGVLQRDKIERCKQWVQLTGNILLMQCLSATLHKKFYVCSKHFSDDQFYNKSRKMLRRDSVPDQNVSNILTDDEVLKFPVLGHQLDVFAGVDDFIENVPNLRTVLQESNNIGTERDNGSSGSQTDLNNNIHDDKIQEKFDDILREDKIKDKYFKQFDKDMKSLKWFTCPQCKESFVARYKPRSSCLHNINCKNYSAENKMDPGEVPDELKDLSLVEQQLISRVRPQISVYRIKHHQFGYSGNVINFSQAVTEVAKKLPHNINELNSIITVRTKSLNSAPREFHVRAAKVKSALIWLKANNPYYYDVEICDDNLNLLPEDDNVFGLIQNVEVPDGLETESDIDDQEKIPRQVYDSETESGEENEDDDDGSETESDIETEIENVQHADSSETESDIENADRNMRSTSTKGCSSNNYEEVRHIDESFVPNMPSTNQDDQVELVLEWPSISQNPLSEFTTLGYICQAFPCLFPYGKADLREPRDKTIGASEYFKHLLRFHDRRFEKHPTFRFFALNSIMRWNATAKGNLYVKRNDEFENMTVEELKAKIRENPQMLEKIMYQCSTMRGTRPFWKSKSKELLQMIEQLGMPTLFFTLSAADLHWPGLFKILAPDEDVATMSSTRRRELIATYPIIVDHYFSDRVNSFISKVVKPKFGVTDYWYRIEYQHRGSPHVHGILWLDNAPDVTDLPNKSAEEIRKILDYFGNIICTLHPNINTPPSTIHPCQVELDEVIDLKKDLAELLNRVQRHTKCTAGYCLKKKAHSKELGCRFKFPKDMCDCNEISFPGDGLVEYVSERNDPRLNNYNPYWILMWRANMDIKPVLSKKALVNYLAKYVSKSETKSFNLEELINNVCNNVKNGVTSVLQKLFIKVCSERDYSAQEVGHLIMGERLVRTNDRAFVYIYFKGDDDWIQLEDGESKYGKSIVEKYVERSQHYENKSLWHMAQWYNFTTKKDRVRKSIVMVCPNIQYREDSNNERYFRMKVLLHVPWRHIDEFLSQNCSWEEIYNKNSGIIKQGESLITLCGIEAEVEEAEANETGEDFNYDTSIEDWMAISSLGPNSITQQTDLGKRHIDVSYDWNACTSKYLQFGSIAELQSFLLIEKEKHSIDNELLVPPDVQLNCEQLKIVHLVEKQIELIKNSDVELETAVPKSVIVQGSAGTGKSLVIKIITYKVQSAFGIGAILLIAPTGVAAINIMGSTLHSKLHIFQSRDFCDLEGAAARKFCNSMKDVKFVICDEFSMLGCSTVAMIDRRLRQATGKADEDFGGLNIFFFGDIWQLGPVMDTPLYSCKTPSDKLKKHGKYVWENIHKAVFLKTVHRQADDRFKTLLHNVSRGTVTVEDYKLLETRFFTNVSAQERKMFDKALNLFPGKKKVLQENMKYLSGLRFELTNMPVPIIQVFADHNCEEAVGGSVDQAGGLSPVLYLGPSCKIMLRANLWTEMGLVNGAVATIVDIVYEENAKPFEERPAVLMCIFDGYKGPYLGNDPSNKIIPISAVSRSWSAQSSIQCTRTNFPVQIAHAVTIHKSQGLTLDKASIDIDEKEFSSGLTFVALSRAKALSGLLLTPFTLKRFLKINMSSVLHQKRKMELRLMCKQL